MSEIRQPCTACDGTGNLMVGYYPGDYKPHRKLPCTVCKGYGYMRPVSDFRPMVQQDLVDAVGKTDAQS